MKMIERFIIMLLPLVSNISMGQMLGMETVCKLQEDSGDILFDCHNLNLKNIPKLFPLNTTKLDLSNNKITRVSNYSFTSVKKLVYLDLKNNQIDHLEVFAFYGCNRLQHLDLSINRINITTLPLPHSVFDQLFQLRWLNIKQLLRGKFKGYPERIFKNLKNIEHLKIDAPAEPCFAEYIGGLHNLKELDLSVVHSSCHMKTLTNNTFQALSNTSLETLDISGCSLTHFETGVFKPLTKLTTVYMRKVKIGMKKSLMSLACFVGRKMKLLDLSEVTVAIGKSPSAIVEDGILNGTDFTYLKDICIKKIRVRKNNILFVNLQSLSSTTFSECVKYIDASENRIYGGPWSYLIAVNILKAIEYIDVSHQNLAFRFYFSQEVQQRVEKINNVDEGGIAVNMKQKQSGSCPPVTKVFYLPTTLRHANISVLKGHIGNLRKSFCINAPSLTDINASFIGIYDLTGNITGLENVTALDLSGNIYLRLKETFFDTFPSLENLSLSHMSFQQNTVHVSGRRLLQPLSKLKGLQICNNGLRHLPDNLFDANFQLQYLDLSKNLFTAVPFYPELPPQLQVLDISWNALGFLDETVQLQLETHADSTGISLQLLLNGNLFICGCGSIEFLFWLKKTKVSLDNKRNYTCLLENGVNYDTSLQLKDMNKLWRRCKGVSLFYFASSLLTLFIASLLSVLLVKTNKTFLVNMFMNVLRKEIPKPRRADFRQDLYVSYAEADYQWVCHQLCPELERRNLSLFIWDRDSIPGDSIPDQIAENISQSWKILLYFTDNFVGDPWTYMSMMAAINSVDNCSPEKVILLLPEEEHPSVPDCILDVVPESCIIRVPLGNEDEQWWDTILAVIMRAE